MKPIIVTGRVIVPNEACRKRNPHIFGSASVAGLQNPQRQPNQRSQGEDRQLEKSTRGVGYRITLVSLRSKLVDAHDNLRTGCKPLVDALTASLGFASDDNPRLEWMYAQAVCANEGTIVKIEEVISQ